MIALLLAAQIAATAAPAAQPPVIRPANELIRALPGKQACMTNPPGQVEVALRTTPSALYRDGDRPAKGLRKWADYPDGQLCAVSR